MFKVDSPATPLAGTKIKERLPRDSFKTFQQQRFHNLRNQPGEKRGTISRVPLFSFFYSRKFVPVFACLMGILYLNYNIVPKFILRKRL